MFKTLKIDRKNRRIMGVQFTDVKTLEKAAYAIGSNMYEGFKPTARAIRIIRDYSAGKISKQELARLAKAKAYE